MSTILLAQCPLTKVKSANGRTVKGYPRVQTFKAVERDWTCLDDIAADLNAEDIDALLILGIVNVADGFTVNLAGPLVVNLTAQTIAQVVQDADLPTAAPLNGGN